MEKQTDFKARIIRQTMPPPHIENHLKHFNSIVPVIRLTSAYIQIKYKL